MKDSVKEFEDLDNRINALFEGLGWLNPGNWFKDKPKQGQPNRSYSRGSALSNYLSKIDAGECEYGTSNGRFSSEPGTDSASFYDQTGNLTGKVANIKPFLKQAGITKQTLRCYDLNKDPLKIRWLFDGNFEAEILGWDSKKKKVIFQGKWNKGLFGGISYKTPSQTPEAENKVYGFYILTSRNKLKGPYSSNQIVKSVQNGSLSVDSIIKPENSADYQQIKDNKLLSMLIKTISTKQTKSSLSTTSKPITKPKAVKNTKKKP